MSALTNYLESGLLNHIFRGVSYSAPATLYIGLTQNFISGNLESGIIDEPSTGAYARQAYTSNGTNWTAPYESGSSMVIHNLSAIQFPLATANIGNVSGVFIADSLSSGNILFYGELSYPRNIRQGDQFVFSSGALKVKFD